MTLVGIRAPRRDGSHDLDPTMIAAAIKASGRYRYHVIGKARPSHVALEALEVDPSRGEHWQARCLHPDCDHAERLAVRPLGVACLVHGTMLRLTCIPAGWRWLGDSDWPMARAVETGATTPDPKGLWTRFPIACLFGKAIRELWKLHCPDALPMGIRVFHEDEPPAPLDRAPAAWQAPAPARASVLADEAPRLTKRQREATMALASSLAGHPVATIDGKEDERAREQAEQEAAARFEAEVAADTRPPVRDPGWLEDDTNEIPRPAGPGPDSPAVPTVGTAAFNGQPVACPERVAEAVHAEGAVPSVPSMTLPAGNSREPSRAVPHEGLPAGGVTSSASHEDSQRGAEVGSSASHVAMPASTDRLASRASAGVDVDKPRSSDRAASLGASPTCPHCDCWRRASNKAACCFCRANCDERTVTKRCTSNPDGSPMSASDLPIEVVRALLRAASTPDQLAALDALAEAEPDPGEIPMARGVLAAVASGAATLSPEAPASEASAKKDDHRSRPRHRWKDADTCSRCQQTKGTAEGACPGKPPEAAGGST